jgi:hypothetical protein
MARRRNYGFDRRQREATQRSRQEAKRARKAERATQGAQGTAEDAGAPVGQWEWFSASRARVVVTEPNQRPTADGVDDWVLLTDASEEPQA